MCPPDPRHEYPPADWTAADLADALRADGTSGLPTYADSDAWAAMRSDPRLRSFVRAIRERADRDRDTPLPAPSAAEYLRYHRTGDRAGYEEPYFARQRRLSAFALAECFEREGRYLDPVLDAAWAICEATTWVVPAHLPDRERTAGLPGERPPPEDRYIGLFSARTALVLAELDRLLGERLHPALRERLRTEIEERVLVPYEATDDHHWQVPPVGNWNAVCNASVAVAALRVLDDPDRQARIVEQAAGNLRHYLAGFDADGCTPEGVLYWNFGFGHYVLLATALDARTDGEFSLFAPPVVGEIARFPLRVELSPGRTVAFSDAEERAHPAAHVACPAGIARDAPGLAARGRERVAERDVAFRQHSNVLPELLRALVWSRRVPDDWSASTAPPARRTFFGGHEWWLARAAPDDPDGLAVAAKAGHNDEPHNHNDCGSFVVHARRESPLCDLGAPTYDKGYFGPERYEYLTARSLGHSVPLVNGHEQATGSEHAARVLDRRADERRDAIRLDLTACYPDAAGLDGLRRTVALDRDPGRPAGGRVTVTDEAAFRADADDGGNNDGESNGGREDNGDGGRNGGGNGDGTGIGEDGPEWASVLVSYFPIESTDEGLAVTGDRGRTRVDVASEPAGATVHTEHLPDAVDVSDRDDLDVDARDVWRARVVPPTATRSTVELTVEPEPAPSSDSAGMSNSPSS